MNISPMTRETIKEMRRAKAVTDKVEEIFETMVKGLNDLSGELSAHDILALKLSLRLVANSLDKLAKKDGGTNESA